MAGAAAKGKEVLDQSAWEICAGLAEKMPPVGTLLYYFPARHGDYSVIRDSYLCKIKEIKLFINEETDELYSVMELLPCDARSEPPPQSLIPARDCSPVRFSSKILGRDDAEGSRIAVPEACAEHVFPPLDMRQTPPSQALRMRDLQGKVWPFVHRYGGSPAQHCLTTGWKEFADSKRLKRGQSVVFVKSAAGELLVAVRRWPANSRRRIITGLNVRTDYGHDITAEEVVEAVRQAERGLPFKVFYYPRVGWPCFVLLKETVDAALRVPWSVGLRVKRGTGKLWMESGSVTRFCSEETCASWPWKCLEVCWDEPKMVEMVNPWEVAPAEEPKREEMSPSSSAAEAEEN